MVSIQNNSWKDKVSFERNKLMFTRMGRSDLGNELKIPPGLLPYYKNLLKLRI